jgi:hypothetical protein
MPHNAGDYVITNVAPNGMSAPLNHADAAYIQRILREDAKDYLYSGLISLANAFASLFVDNAGVLSVMNALLRDIE